MEHKFCCVIDKKGFYKEFVVVHIVDDIEEVYHYEMQEGETIIERNNTPRFKCHAESEGFIKPKWNGSEWVEGATDTEIAEWNEEHPAPEPVEPEPTEIEILQDEVTALQLALVEQYEVNLALQEEVTNTQLALVELYEGVM